MRLPQTKPLCMACRRAASFGAFDAMTSTRSYRGARPVPEAVAELRKWAGTQFDPAFVDAFVAAIERDGWKPPEAARPGPDDPLTTAPDSENVSASVKVAADAPSDVPASGSR